MGTSQKMRSQRFLLWRCSCTHASVRLDVLVLGRAHLAHKAVALHVAPAPTRARACSCPRWSCALRRRPPRSTSRCPCTQTGSGIASNPRSSSSPHERARLAVVERSRSPAACQFTSKVSPPSSTRCAPRGEASVPGLTAFRRHDGRGLAARLPALVLDSAAYCEPPLPCVRTRTNTFSGATPITRGAMASTSSGAACARASRPRTWAQRTRTPAASGPRPPRVRA